LANRVSAWRPDAFSGTLAPMISDAALPRRAWLQRIALVACAPALRAVEPIVRQGPPRLRLSLAAYSFRQYFKDQPGGASRSPNERTLTMNDFIDYCAAHGCDGAELTSYYFPANLTNEFLLETRRHAFLRGVSVSGTAVGNTFTHPSGEARDREIAHVKRWIDHARVLGAPHIRVFAGNAEGQSLAVAKRNAIDALSECAEYAAQAGVFLGLENHGGIVAEPDDLLDIVRSVQSQWVGINLDTGNFHTEDPYADLERCVPYSVNVQVKIEMRRKGGQNEPADLNRLIAMLRDGGYQGWVALEYEARENPFDAVPPILEKMAELIRA
jgi:sugar phosphate isomerase/epimerase